MKIPVLNIDGKSLSDYGIDLAIEPQKYNFEHLAYLIRKQQQAALRQGTHSTKTRGEVSGGGAKPYKQKGTGKARRGSNRTPLRVGGGVSFGPKPRSYSVALNRKVIKLGYKLAVVAKQSDIVVLDVGASFSPSTKAFQRFVRNVKSAARKVLVVGSDALYDSSVYKSARNLDGVVCAESTWVPLESLVVSDLIVLTPTAVKEVHERFLS